MGAGIEDVVAIKALETGIVPPVPNYKEPDPDLGELNLSLGGAYPVDYALRLAAGFGSQIAMSLLRWTPMPDGRHRSPSELGYAYRIVDPRRWQRWLDSLRRSPRRALEIDHPPAPGRRRRATVRAGSRADRQAVASPTSAGAAGTAPAPPARARGSRPEPVPGSRPSRAAPSRMRRRRRWSGGR